MDGKEDGMITRDIYAITSASIEAGWWDDLCECGRCEWQCEAPAEAPGMKLFLQQPCQRHSAECTHA